uniref:Uncharacterized protein n=1 Tax=Triticum urartu TaxID=4572 RepID=A0A8R7Q3H8_TRIUA
TCHALLLLEILCALAGPKIRSFVYLGNEWRHQG